MNLPVVIDTNLYFSALYSPDGNEGDVLKRAIDGEILALSPNTVREELRRNLAGKLDYSNEEVDRTLSTLPTIWVPRPEYRDHIEDAEKLLNHAEDAPILACALALDAGVLTGNTSHFDTAAVREQTVVWRSRELLDYLDGED